MYPMWTYCPLMWKGGELDILKSIDYDRVKIRVIQVENNYSDPRMYRFLISKGYKYVKKILNDEFYVLN